jgi:RNA polymerase sigma-70 factor, ECF subfamily
MADPESLAPVFLERLGACPAGIDRARLETSLRTFDAAGRSAWAGIVLSAEAFVAHAATHLGGEADPVSALARLHAGDLFLACACAQGATGALAAFESAFLARVPRLVARIDGSAAFADDVAQEIREAFLLPGGRARTGIAGYSGRGALANYLRIIALRIALRLRGERGPGTASEERLREVESSSTGDPEFDYLKIRYRPAYESAFQSALMALTDHDRLLLRLQYVDGLKLDAIAALYRMHRSTAVRWRAKIRRTLLETTRQRLRESIHLTDSEFESLFHLVRSEMHVSLTRALGCLQAK